MLFYLTLPNAFLFYSMFLYSMLPYYCILLLSVSVLLYATLFLSTLQSKDSTLLFLFCRMVKKILLSFTPNDIAIMPLKET